MAARLLTPSLAKVRRMCVPTVHALISKMSATILLECPSATNLAISRSLGLSAKLSYGVRINKQRNPSHCKSKRISVPSASTRPKISPASEASRQITSHASQQAGSKAIAIPTWGRECMKV